MTLTWFIAWVIGFSRMKVGFASWTLGLLINIEERVIGIYQVNLTAADVSRFEVVKGLSDVPVAAAAKMQVAGEALIVLLVQNGAFTCRARSAALL